ncbi:MAG: hypothetical protein JO287_04660 [Pseudonocardiales bacterium]|nr:hypothetical protein [Pseudonocardiales bacterium]
MMVGLHGLRLLSQAAWRRIARPDLVPRPGDLPDHADEMVPRARRVHGTAAGGYAWAG